jgi:glycosyltransferase involved in cell wall biosynthesis
MKKIMIVTNSVTGGGAERAMNLLSNELLTRGFAVILVPINSSKNDLIVPKSRTYPLNRDHRAGILGTLWALLKFNWIVFRFSPAVIILNCDLPELFGLLLISPRKIIVVEHSNPAWTTRLTLGKLVRKLMSFRKVTWGAVSSHLSIWGLNREPDVILPNILLPSSEVFPPLEVTQNLKRLVFIGRLEPNQKRPQVILEIAKSLNLPVIIIGEGQARSELEDFSNSMSQDVSFHGFVTNPWKYVREGDLLIVPSAWEGDGLVVIEGMQKNLPMLLADIKDFRRFGFQEAIYCNETENYVTQINAHKNSLSVLHISKEKKYEILDARESFKVGKAWEDILN